jgi:raffinose/stachyose/melibiose transport system permease protein
LGGCADNPRINRFYWNELSAAILIVTVPTVLIFLFFQRYVFAGLMDGAIKG